MTNEEKLVAARAEMALLKTKLASIAKEVFEEGIAGLFTNFTNVTQFSWTQYTPTWCDGDVCEFSANKQDITVVFKDSEEEVEFSSWGSRNKAPTTDNEVAAKEILNFLGKFENDEFEQAFGEGLIVATADGITTEYYDHE